MKEIKENKVEELVVKDNEQNKRLDMYIAEEKKELSRTTIKRLLENGDILVNEKIQKASYKPEAGDRIQINMPEVVETKLVAQDIPVPVIYEDKDIILFCVLHKLTFIIMRNL